MLCLETVNIEQGGCPLPLLALRNMIGKRKRKTALIPFEEKQFPQGTAQFNKNTDVKETIREETKNFKKLTDYGFRVQKDKVVRVWDFKRKTFPFLSERLSSDQKRHIEDGVS